MFEQVFNQLDNILRQEAGCTTELDYTEQTSWLLFLKYLDDLEATKATTAELEGRGYTPIIEDRFKWTVWATPKTAQGQIDHNKAKTGPDLIDFVNNELMPYLKSFKGEAESPDTIEYKIGEIFHEISSKFQSGYTLRDALDQIDELKFRSQKEKHELSQIYEEKIKRMGNAGRNGGEYYTPRPLVRSMIKVMDPKVDQTIYDGACGSAGFLCEAYDYLREKELTTSEYETLHTKTFYGKEKKSLAYVIAIMNLILHGIEAPNIIHGNTLADHEHDVQEKDRHDIILANPPFGSGGSERSETQQNFPIKTGETAFLFLQHFIRMLKTGGKAAVVIKNTFLSNGDNASTSLRKSLLEDCKLDSVLVCPQGTFQGAGVKTVVLFYEKGAPTSDIWFYELNLGRTLGKTNPLNDDDLKEFLELEKTKADSDNSWTVSVSDLDPETFDLSVKNPNKDEEVVLRDPEVIIRDIEVMDHESSVLLKEIKELTND
jgi:type I restriction enzyme M protein